MTPARKFEATPIGSPAPETIRYSRFLIPSTTTPAIGEKISAAINAGTSLKSIFKYGGRKGNGKFKKNNTSEMVPNNAKIISFRSEEHTSELQSRFDLVCRLLLEKKR